MTHTANELKLLKHVETVFALAQNLYGVDFKGVDVKFNLKGRVAGYAWWRGRGVQTYGLRFNRTLVNNNSFETMLLEVVPHEIAHLVCFMRPELGKDHDSGWKRVCIALGGNGQRLHNEDIIYGTGQTYEYVTSTGKTIRLSEKRHKRVQGGETLRYRGDYGNIPAFSSCMIVGRAGEEFSQPIPFDAINSPKTLTVERIRSRNTNVELPKGVSKAALSRELMKKGMERGDSYEAIITAMMELNGYTRGLAVATYKANARKVGIAI